MEKKTKVPKLRFPGFTEDWEQHKLGNLMNVTSVKRILQSDWTDEGVRFLRARDIVSESKNENPTDRLYISQKKYEQYSTISGKVSINDLLVTGVGTIGVPFLVKDKNPLYFKDGNIIWFQNNLKIDGKFFYYSFIADSIQEFIKVSAGTGTVGTYTIDSGKKTPIILPESDIEQKQIGAFFASLDHLITLHQHKLTHLQAKKKSLLQKMFPKKGERFPELRFPGFTYAWEQRKLGEVAKFSKGSGYCKDDLVDKGIPIILYGRLYTKYQTKIINVDTFVAEQSNSVYSTGKEVIVPASGETAEDISIASAVMKSGILLGGDLNIVYPYETLNSVFLAVQLSNGNAKKEMSKRAQGKSVVHLHNADLQEAEISIPQIAEQQQIGCFFEQFDNLITFHQRKLTHLQKQKKALLQQMFV